MQERLRAALGKLIDKWKALETRQKLHIIVAGVVLVLLIGLTLYFQLRTNYSLIVKNQDYSVVTQLQNALSDAGIKSKKAANGRDLLVDEKRASDALGYIEENNVLSESDFTYDNLISYTGMGTTELMKRYSIQEYKKSQLESIIGSMYGIQTARVELDLPDSTKFYLPQKEPTASIYVVTGSTLENRQAESIARLVERSVMDLKRENITVVDQNYNVLFNGEISASSTGTSTRLDAELAIRNNVEAQIRKALDPIYDSVSVMTSFSFDWDEIETHSTQVSNPFDPESNTGFIKADKIDSSSYVNTSPSGEPGLTANDQAAPGYETQNGDQSSAKLKNTEAEYIYNVVDQIKKGQMGKLLKDDSNIGIVVYRTAVYDEAYMTDNNRLGTDANGDPLTWTDFKNSTFPTEFSVETGLIRTLQVGTGIPADNIVITGYSIPVFVDREIQPINLMQIIFLALVVILLILLAIFFFRKTEPEEVNIEPELSVEEIIVTGKQEDAMIEAEKIREIEFGADSEVKQQIEKFIAEKPEAVAQLLRNWLSDDWE